MDELDETVVAVRADTTAFARDVAMMRDELIDCMGDAAERARMRLEMSLLTAARTGSFAFNDLKNFAIQALDQIAARALRMGLDSIFGGGSSGPIGSLGSVLGGLLGAPGRATGGPVSPGRIYTVGERGPEVFVPTSSGRIETLSGAAAGGFGREVRVAISVNAGAGESAEVLRRSGRQVARAVKGALEG